MAYTIRFKPSAARAFERLPKDIQRRIAPRIDALSDNPRPPGVEKLEGEENGYRIRVGDYRVVYEIYEKSLLVYVAKVAARGRVYRRP